MTTVNAAQKRPMAGQLQIRLLGPLTVEIGGRPVALPSRKSRALLGYLALREGAEVSRGLITGLLWGDRQESHARASLRQALSDLRSALSQASVKPIVATRDTLTWLAGSAWIDARAFEAAAGGSEPDALRAAIGLVSGELMEGLAVEEPGFEEWLAKGREHFRSLQTSIRTRLMDVAEQEGRLEEALTNGLALLSLDPLQEMVHRAVMRLYAAQGRHASALAQYEKCCRVLSDQLGVRPEPETDTLARRIKTDRRTGVPRAAEMSSPAREPGDPPHSKPSIAVLPFDNISGDSEQTYFSDGIADDIITELSRFRELLVIARNSSFHFRGGSVDIKHVAEQLGAQFILEGSVRRAGNQVRVNIQLIEAATTAHIWADRYDRDLNDVFKIQDEITRMVVTQVAVHARAAVAHRKRSHPTDNLSAYDNLLRARQVFTTHDRNLPAEAYLLKALALDPNLAIAHALMGHLYCVRYYYDGDERHLEKALTSGRRALELDPEEPWANWTLGCGFEFLGRLDEARHHFDRAIVLNPNEATFLAGSALCYNFMGRTEPALQHIEETVRRDPYSFDWYWDNRGVVLTAAGRFRDAIESFRHLKSLPPWVCCYLAICHIELGDHAGARGALEELANFYPDRAALEILAKEPYGDPATLERLLGSLRRAAEFA